MFDGGDKIVQGLLEPARVLYEEGLETCDQSWQESVFCKRWKVWEAAQPNLEVGPKPMIIGDPQSKVISEENLYEECRRETAGGLAQHINDLSNLIAFFNTWEESASLSDRTTDFLKRVRNPRCRLRLKAEAASYYYNIGLVSRAVGAFGDITEKAIVDGNKNKHNKDHVFICNDAIEAAQLVAIKSMQESRRKGGALPRSSLNVERSLKICRYGYTVEKMPSLPWILFYFDLFRGFGTPSRGWIEEFEGDKVPVSVINVYHRLTSGSDLDKTSILGPLKALDPHVTAQYEQILWAFLRKLASGGVKITLTGEDSREMGIDGFAHKALLSSEITLLKQLRAPHQQ